MYRDRGMLTCETARLLFPLLQTCRAAEMNAPVVEHYIPVLFGN